MPLARGIVRRPLIDLSRADVLSYLEARGIPWRTDASNGDNRYFRNRVRNWLVPFLEAQFPGWGKALDALGETQALAAGFIAAEARRRVSWEAFLPVEAAGNGQGSGLRTGAERFFAQPEILREEALFQGINRLRDEFFLGSPESGSLRRQSLRLFCQGGHPSGAHPPESRPEEARSPEARFPGMDLGFCRLRLEGGFLVIAGVSAEFRGERRAEEAGFSLLIKEPGVYKLNLHPQPGICRRHGEGVCTLAVYPLSSGTEGTGKDGFVAALPLVLRPGYRDDVIAGENGRRLSLRDMREALPGRERSGPIIAALDSRGLAAFIGLSAGKVVIRGRRGVPDHAGRSSFPARAALSTGDFFFSIGGIDV
jgi:tRNA(Ile)-lysidine synthase